MPRAFETEQKHLLTLITQLANSPPVKNYFWVVLLAVISCQRGQRTAPEIR
jgi:hypothetical protein